MWQGLSQVLALDSPEAGVMAAVVVVAGTVVEFEG